MGWIRVTAIALALPVLIVVAGCGGSSSKACDQAALDIAAAV